MSVGNLPGCGHSKHEDSFCGSFGIPGEKGVFSVMVELYRVDGQLGNVAVRRRGVLKMGKIRLCWIVNKIMFLNE